MKRQPLIAIGVVVLAVAAALAVWWSRRPRRDVSPEFALAPLLVKQQYIEVPLRRSKIASLDVAAKIEGESLLLYLDTGNTDNMIEPAVAQRLKLRSQLASHGITVLKETAPPQQVVLEGLSVGGVRSPVAALLVEQNNSNAARKELGEPPCDGLLCAGYLRDHAAVIDNGALRLFLLDRGGRPPLATDAAERAARLKQAGYVELPLALHAGGLADVAVEFNGQPVVLSVDTGAQFSHIDTATARRLNLPPPKKSRMTVTFLDGSKTPLEFTKVEHYAFGPISGQLELVLMDMTALNGWRKSEGLPPWDGLLAADVLQAFSAVIDYGASKLFLRVTGGTRQ
jgi:predicted aspartyl protease